VRIEIGAEIVTVVCRQYNPQFPSQNSYLEMRPLMVKPAYVAPLPRPLHQSP
jgi:hypothetical protein